MESKGLGESGWEGDTGRFNLFDEYRKLLEEVAMLLKDQGIAFTPYSHISLPRIQKLTFQKQQDGLIALRNYLSVLQSAKINEVHSGNRYTVQSFVEKQGWHIGDDVLELINNDMMVEIYDRDSHQVFRDVKIFSLIKLSLITVSLEELCSTPWFELWEREAKITMYMLELVGMILKGELTGCMSYLIPEHEVRDRNQRLKVGAPMEPLFMTPLFDQSGAVAGYLSAFRTF